MRKIIKHGLIAVVLVVCAIVVYELWQDIQYSRKIPEYLRLCMQQSARPLVEDHREAPTRQNNSQSSILTVDPHAEYETNLNMGMLALSICKYAHENGQLPESTQTLGVDEKYLLDAWSNHFVYVRDSDDTFVICSPGSSGLFEGKMEDGETASRFSLKVFEKWLERNAVLKDHEINRGLPGEVR